MKYRTLGTHDGGLKVSAIGIGCMPMVRGGNISYGAATDDESIATIHEAIDLGVTFFDTAEIYGPFSNEELVGRAIKGKRDGLVIATKFGFEWNGNDIAGRRRQPGNARRACEGSLQRLGIDTIDLFYQHRVDPNVPIEETVGGMAELVKEGKVRHIAPVRSRRRHDPPRGEGAPDHGVAERIFDLGARCGGRDPAACRENGIGFVPYSPLGRGFLAGAIRSLDDLPADDWRRNDPRYSSRERCRRTSRSSMRSPRWPTRHGVSNAQVALAWLLAQGDDIVPIPGAKRRETMRDIGGRADVTLSADDLATIDAAAPKGGTAGPRYNEAGMKRVKL